MTIDSSAVRRWLGFFLGQRGHDDGVTCQQDEGCDSHHPEQIPSDTENNLIAPYIPFITNDFHVISPQLFKLFVFRRCLPTTGYLRRHIRMPVAHGARSSSTTI